MNTKLVCLVLLGLMASLVRSMPYPSSNEHSSELQLPFYNSQDESHVHEDAVDVLIAGYLQKIAEVYSLRSEINNQFENLNQLETSSEPQITDLKNTYNNLETLIDDLLIKSQIELNNIIEKINERSELAETASSENGGLIKRGKLFFSNFKIKVKQEIKNLCDF